MTLRAQKKVFSTRRPLGSFLMSGVALVIFGAVIWFSTKDKDDAAQKEIPVIKAEAGEIRVRPEQQGGMQIAYRDMEIYNKLDPSAGDVEDRVEKVVFDETGDVVALQFDNQELLKQKIDDYIDKNKPLSADAAQEPQPLKAPEDTEGVVAESPVEMPAEEGLNPAPQQAAPAVATPVPTPTPRQEKLDALSEKVRGILDTQQDAAKPSVAAKGNYIVQLGAVSTREAAEKEWTRLQKMFPGELGGLSLNIEEANLGAKGILYRIRSSSISQEHAERICGTIKAAGAAGCLAKKL